MPVPTLPTQMALKCADLSHLTSTVEVHKQWVTRLEEVRGRVEERLQGRKRGGATIRHRQVGGLPPRCAQTTLLHPVS